MTHVLIGIQARSTSKRMPGKALAQLYNKPVLSWVINACVDSAKFITRRTNCDITVDVVLLIPKGDKIAEVYNTSKIIEGDEHDVLSRYVDAVKIYDSDYIVRITGDCPFLTAFTLSNYIFKVVNNNIDYLSNADPLCRTELDGRDIEVLSRKALDWLDEVSVNASDREHCTPQMRTLRPKHLVRAHFLNRLDVSDIKLSIDTKEDLNEAEKRISSFFRKKAIAEDDVGRLNVFFN